MPVTEVQDGRDKRIVDAEAVVAQIERKQAAKVEEVERIDARLNQLRAEIPELYSRRVAGKATDAEIQRAEGEQDALRLDRAALDASVRDGAETVRRARAALADLVAHVESDARRSDIVEAMKILERRNRHLLAAAAEDERYRNVWHRGRINLPGLSAPWRWELGTDQDSKLGRELNGLLAFNPADYGA